MKKRLNNNAIDLFENVVNDDVLGKIDKAFGKAFQNIVNFNRGKALEKYQKMGSLPERLKKLDELLDPKKTKEAFTEFFNFLKDINEIVELMERSTKSDPKKSLVFFTYLNSILTEATTKKSKTIQDFLTTIQKLLKKENKDVEIIKNSQY